MLALNVLLVITATDRWAEPVSIGLRGWMGDTMVALMPIGWCLLIARVIQEEPVPGRRELWLTRPYRRSSLAIAKAIFIGVFVHLTTTLAHLTILIASGIPFLVRDLVLNQFVLAGAISLPAAALAVLTRSIGQYVVACVAVFACFVGWVTLNDALDLSAGYLASEPPPDLFRSARHVGVPLIALVSLTTVVWQYRTRHTGHVAGFFAAGLAGAALIAAAWPYVRPVSVEPQLQYSSIAADEITVGRPRLLDISDAAQPAGVRFRGLDIPVAWTTPDDSPVRIRGWQIDIETAAGQPMSFAAPRSYRGAVGQGVVYSLDSESLDLLRGVPLTIAVTLFAEKLVEFPSGSLAIDGTPLSIDDRLQCRRERNLGRTVGGSAVPGISCRAAFRFVGMANTSLDRSNHIWRVEINRELSTLPFAITPVAIRGLAGVYAAAEDPEPLAVMVRKRSELLTHRVAFENMVLEEVTRN